MFFCDIGKEMLDFDKLKKWKIWKCEFYEKDINVRNNDDIVPKILLWNKLMKV